MDDRDYHLPMIVGEGKWEATSKRYLGTFVVTLDDNSVLRNSCGRALMEDQLGFFLPVIERTLSQSSVYRIRINTMRAREREVTEAVRRARENERNMSRHERREHFMEMRETFGVGKNVINIITGARHRT